MSNSTATLKSTTAITPLPNRAFDPDAVRLFLKPLTPVQQGELARLDSTTKPPVLQPADVAAKAAKLVTSSRNEFGQVDTAQLAKKLVNATPDVLREVQKHLTPVQQGELAREISTSKPDVLKPADTPAIAAKLVASSRDASGQINIPQLAVRLLGAPPEIVQEVKKLLTTVQQKELGSELLDLTISNQNAPVTQRFQLFPGKGGDFFRDKIIEPTQEYGEYFVDGVRHVFNTIQDFFTGTVADAANAARDDIVGAFTGVGDTLKNIFDGDIAKDFLAYAGEGAEWGEHLFNLSTDPNALKGFGIGFAEGVGEGILALATDVGKIAQLAADTSPVGFLGDFIRDWDATGEFPPWLEEIVPSADRGQQAIQDTIDTVKNVSEYVASRAANPRLLRDDVKNYISEKWETLKGDWAKAHAEGPEAEGRWFGKIAGRAAFEIAINFIPGKAVLTVAKAVEGFADFARKADRITNPTDATKIGDTADNLAASADQIVNSGYVTDSELDSLEKSWEDLESFTSFRLDSTPEGNAALEKVEMAKEKVENAIQVAHRLETPNVRPLTPGKVSQDVELSSYARYLDDEFNKSPVQYGNSSVITIAGDTNIAELSAGVANLTDKYGVEYAIFKRENSTAADEIILVRGDAAGIDISDPILSDINKTLFSGNRYELYGHTQPGHDNNSLHASDADQDILRKIHQTSSSLIINANGQTARFSGFNKFDESTVNHINTKTYNDADSFNKDANKPSPYTSYNFDGFTYQTDSKGRIISASGDLNLVPPNTARENTSLQTQIGHEGREQYHDNWKFDENGKIVPNYKYPDVGFHLIGHQFGGGVNRLNVVPGDAILNGTRNNTNGPGKVHDYGNMEKLWSDVLKADPNNEVNVNIRPVYGDPTKAGYIEGRPESFEIEYKIFRNGQWEPTVTNFFQNDVPQDAGFN